MNLPALARFAEYCQQNRISGALISNPATVTWLTGYAPPIQTGPNPFEGGPALAWWDGANLTLLLSDAEAGSARPLGIEARDYPAYTIDCPPAGFLNQAAGLKELILGTRSNFGKIAVEFNFLPASLLGTLKEALPRSDFMPIDSALDPMRAIKTPEEVDRIRAALALCDLAQAETRRLIRPGIGEIEVWGQVKARLEHSAGVRLPVLADFIAGTRTAEIGGLPGSYVLREGDAVIADMVPRLQGYWGDNCGTHFIGEPPAQLREAYETVLRVLRAAMATVRPGLRACDLDAQMRKAIEAGGYASYPHHSGHGLGTTYHEEPRIVPYNTQTLQPGMVIALEPGVYLQGVGGVRLEDVLLVTQDGCEVLTHHLPDD